MIFWYRWDRETDTTEPTDVATAEQLLADPAGLCVELDQVNDEVQVSTVFLVLDHALNQAVPQLFETMVLGGAHDRWCTRYETAAQARAGHANVLACLRAGLAPRLPAPSGVAS